MRNLMPITRPMGAADLTQAAEDAGRYALALSDLSRAVAAYEAATGYAIAVVDADKAVMVGFDMASGPDETVFGSLDKTARRVVEEYGNMDHARFCAATEAKQDPELLDAMYPLPVPETGTVEDAADLTALVAPQTAQGEAQGTNSVHPATPATAKPESAASGPKIGLSAIGADNALPKWNGKTIPAELRDAVQHLAKIGPSGPKWGFQQDHEMIERAIDGQTEKLIADVMEFSQSHIRQRFNKLVDRIHARGNSFTREQIRDALQWMLGKTHTAF